MSDTANSLDRPDDVMDDHVGGGASEISSHEIFPSLHEFLQQQKSQPSRHFVIGNPAGDADSLVSAVALAYVESGVLRKDPPSSPPSPLTPIMSIAQADFLTQRPETVLLWQLAGLDLHSLLFLDHLPGLLQEAPSDEAPIQVTLVDHNRLDPGWEAQWGQSVVVQQILDHHYDEQHHLETCPLDTPARQVAFAQDRALVASTCTLVVERLQQKLMGYEEARYPASLGLLLWGVILLDSVNMLPEAGKGTPQDGQALDWLLGRTRWSDLPASTREQLGLMHSDDRPDPTRLFNLLQQAKFDLTFWKKLSVRDALRLDYKSFRHDDKTCLGVSTVLMPLADFVAKENLAQSLAQYREEMGVDPLGVMLTSTNQEQQGQHVRELILCASETFPLQSLVDYLTRGEYGSSFESLQLQEIPWPQDGSSSLEINQQVRAFQQGNVQASRKQVVPIILQYFESR